MSSTYITLKSPQSVVTSDESLLSCKLFHLEQSRLRDQYDWSVPQIHLVKFISEVETETARDGIACL